jgi:hypothetical protein
MCDPSLGFSIFADEMKNRLCFLKRRDPEEGLGVMYGVAKVLVHMSESISIKSDLLDNLLENEFDFMLWQVTKKDSCSTGCGQAG